MRIYLTAIEAFREVERDLWEMGHDVHPDTMQDQYVADDPDFITKEVNAYGFQVLQRWSPSVENEVISYAFPASASERKAVLNYLQAEFEDRVSGQAINPGKAYLYRKNVWSQFLELDGKFAYTYSERMSSQLARVIDELERHPNTRQAIVSLHNSFIDLSRMGGVRRIPCSMYYQLIRRNEKMDLIYTMRSCDFLTHFPIDYMMALRLQSYAAEKIGIPTGHFTYFTASMHAYHKDMKSRGIF